MTDHFDLAIVGAGLVGSAAARHAAASSPSIRVALIGPAESNGSSADERQAFGAHHDEGRITRCTDPDPTWALMAQRSIDRYAEIEESSGIQFFDEVGHLAVGPSESPSLAARAANAERLSVPYERLDEEALRARYPYLAFPAGATASEYFRIRTVACYFRIPTLGFLL